jgi:hypothetical protein
MVRNRAHTALRTQMRSRRLGTPGLLEDLLPVMMDPRPNAADQMIAEEDSRTLAEALASLPEETREALTLFYREGQSVAQVAELLELSEVAVKKRLSRARASLRVSLADIGETLRRSGPTAAFTASVVAALPAAAPPAAAAATLTVSKFAGGSVWLGAVKLLAPLSGILLGGLGGVAGVLFGSRKWLKDAQDEEERRALRRHAWVSSLVVLFYAAALTLSMLWTRHPWWTIGWFVCFILTLAILQHVWLPRIVKRRLESEMRQDPAWATTRRRRERRQAIIGWTLGLIGGSVGLAVGIWSILR